MNPIEQNMETIKTLCDRYRVSKLFAFGSVLTEKFNPESDIDLVVDFDNVGIVKSIADVFNMDVKDFL